MPSLRVLLILPLLAGSLPAAPPPLDARVEALARRLAEGEDVAAERERLVAGHSPEGSWLAGEPVHTPEPRLRLQLIRVHRDLGFPEVVAGLADSLGAAARRHALWARFARTLGAAEGYAVLEEARALDPAPKDWKAVLELLEAVYGTPAKWGENLYDAELRKLNRRRKVEPEPYLRAVLHRSWILGAMQRAPVYKALGFFAHAFRRIDELAPALGERETLRQRHTATLNLAMMLRSLPGRDLSARWCFDRAMSLAQRLDRVGDSGLWITSQWAGDHAEGRGWTAREEWLARSALAVTRRDHDFGNFATGDRMDLADVLERRGRHAEARVLQKEAARIALREQR